MPDRERPLSLWGSWWNAIQLLRPGFSRLRTFMWFVIAVAGLTVRVELLGVTSIVRALNLRPRLYTKLLDHFHSSGIKHDWLAALWAQAVLQLFPHLVRVNGRLVLVGDGIKAPKRGKKMPAVKLLHQQSESNTKPEYIMGHSLQAVGLLVHAARSVFCVPLAVRIHDKRLSCLHPGRRCRPGTAPVSRRRRSQARLGIVRLLAAYHSPRHPAVGVRRCKCTAPDPS